MATLFIIGETDGSAAQRPNRFCATEIRSSCTRGLLTARRRSPIGAALRIDLLKRQGRSKTPHA